MFLDGIFNEGSSMDNDLNTDLLQESLLLAELSTFTEAQTKAFLESEVCQSLLEAKKMRKNTIVRLGGRDDLSRRETLAALELARQAKDPLWAKLRMNRIKERELLGKIRGKYGTKAARTAKLDQKDYIKNRLPNKQELFGNINIR